jgi:TP901 family phage tail tape measure protein
VAGKTEFPLSIVIRAIDKATAGLRSVSQRVATHAKKIEAVGRSLSVGLTAPIVAVGAASISAAAAFEAGMANISTLIDTSTESLEEMGKTVLAIGGRVPVAIDDLTASLYDVRSAGVAASDQFTVLEQSARLGKAGLGTTKQAVDLVTSSVNAFQLKGEEADAVYDQIFKTVKNGKTNIEQLSQGFGAVAGTVAATGTPLDEYLASVAALTTTGLPAAQAHSQLRAVISGLTRETDKSSAVFKKLGAKDFKDLIAKSGGLVPALEKISGKLKGNEAHILELVGSTEALNAVLGLTGGQNKAFVQTLSDMREGVNAVDVAFEKQNATLQSSTQRTKNALTSVGVSIGTILAPAMESLASMLQSLAAWWGSLDRSTQKWIVTIGVVVAAIGPAILIFGKLIAVAIAMKKVFIVIQSLIIGIKALSVALFASPITWVILGIVALVAAGYLLITNWDKVKLFLVSMWEVVTEAFATFLDWLKFAFFNFSPLGIVITHWEPIKGFFAELWLGVTEVFEAAWRIIEDIVSKIVGVVDTVTGAVDTVAGAVSDVGGAIGSFFGSDDEDAGPDVAAGAGAAIGGERLGRLAAAGTSASSAAVSVQFANTPRGTRVESDRRNTASVDLAVGYQLGGL